MHDHMSTLGCSGPSALNVLRNKAFEQTGSSMGSKLQLVERLEQAQQQAQQGAATTAEQQQQQQQQQQNESTPGPAQQPQQV